MENAKPTQLLDARGRPIPYQDLAPSKLYEGPGDSEFRSNAPTLNYDFKRMLDGVERLKIRHSDGRNIEQSLSTLGGAVSQRVNMINRNQWLPEFAGEDLEWGDMAEDALDRYLPMSDMAGFKCRFSEVYRQGCRGLDVDGDFFRAYVKDADGMPRFQTFEAHRIGNLSIQRYVRPKDYEHLDDEAKALAKELDGYIIRGGVVENEYGEIVAYQILSDGPGLRKILNFLPAHQFRHWVDPKFASGNRGFAPILHAIYDWYDIKETRDAEKVKQKRQSEIIGFADTATGYGFEAVNTGGLNGVPMPQKPTEAETEIKRQVIEKGYIQFFKAGSGQRLQFLNSGTPSMSWQEFLKCIEEGAFYALGWDRNMLSLKGMNSAATHAFADLINVSIHRRFNLLAFYAVQDVQWIVAGLIAKKLLPFHPEWDKWGFTPPADFTANKSRDGKSMMDKVRFGFSSHPREIKRDSGRRHRKVLREQAQFIRDVHKVANEFSDDEITIHPEDLVRQELPGQAPATSQPPDNSKPNQQPPPADEDPKLND